MKRLTERDEHGNASIIGVDNEDLQLSLDFDDFNLVAKALNKLSAYEDNGAEPDEASNLIQFAAGQLNVLDLVSEITRRGRELRFKDVEITLLRKELHKEKEEMEKEKCMNILKEKNQ